MNEQQGSYPSVLLPNASIRLFSKDAELRSAALALRDDWRFARVDIRAEDGDVETAIAKYSNEASPDLVLVETQEITDDFSNRLEVLAGSCAENTAAVVIGPVNDVYLYRKLIDMGVSDYLVRPLTSNVLADVFSKILIERLGAPGSKLIAYVGTKGGAGTSTIAQMSALAISGDLQQKTIILDTAAGWSFLSVAMGSESTTTMSEVARAAVSSDKDAFKRMIVAVDEKLSFMATGAEGLLDDSISVDSFEMIINRLMLSYPVVVVDLSRASSTIMRAALSRANEIVFVTMPTLPALRSARGIIQETKNIRGGSDNGLHMVVNMQGITQGQDVSEDDIKSAIKLKTMLTIPFLPKVFGSADVQGKKVREVSGGQEINNKIVKYLIDELKFLGNTSVSGDKKPVNSGFFDEILSKLKTK